MTREEAEKIQVGDELWIKVPAICLRELNGYDGILVKRFGEPQGNVHRSDILSVTPAPREIKVGDPVTWGYGVSTYTVKAIDGDVAWLKRDGEPHRNEFLSDLRHAAATAGDHHD